MDSENPFDLRVGVGSLPAGHFGLNTICNEAFSISLFEFRGFYVPGIELRASGDVCLGVVAGCAYRAVPLLRAAAVVGTAVWKF